MRYTMYGPQLPDQDIAVWSLLRNRKCGFGTYTWADGTLDDQWGFRSKPHVEYLYFG